MYGFCTNWIIWLSTAAKKTCHLNLTLNNILLFYFYFFLHLYKLVNGYEAREQIARCVKRVQSCLTEVMSVGNIYNNKARHL